MRSGLVFNDNGGDIIMTVSSMPGRDIRPLYQDHVHSVCARNSDFCIGFGSLYQVFTWVIFCFHCG